MKLSSPSKLQRLLGKHGIKQAALARAAKVSVSTMSRAVSDADYPQDIEASARIKHTLIAALQQGGCTTSQILKVLRAPKEKALRAATRRASIPLPSKASPAPKSKTARDHNRNPRKGDLSMLLAKQSLGEAARAFFNLVRDPFKDDVQSHEDVFKSKSMSYVRAVLWDNIKNGGMLAVIGESGSGKSTLRCDAIERISREKGDAIIIEPYVLAMEENDSLGKSLKSSAITESIIRALAPLDKPKRTLEARAAQLHGLLKDSRKAGNTHVLIIEEAHCLPKATLKHLKRFLELQDGFKRLLSVILIGQSELRMKLSDKDASVREVVQRCDFAELAPLGDELAKYLAFKFKRVGKDAGEIFNAAAVEALAAKLTLSYGGGGSAKTKVQSLVYPLAVNNLATAAMNKAAEAGLPISPELIALL